MSNTKDSTFEKTHSKSTNYSFKSDPETELLVGRPTKDRQPLSGQLMCLIILTVLGVLYTLYAARSAIFPVVLGLLIALPLRAPVEWLVRLHIPRVLSASLFLGAILLIASGAIIWVLDPASQWIKDTPTNIKRIESKLRNLGGGTWRQVQDATAEVEKIANSIDESSTLQVEIKPPSWTSKALNTTSEMIIGLIICLSLVFLLLAFGERLMDSCVKICPPGWDQRNMRSMFQNVEKMMSRYLLTYTCINAILGVVIGTGLWIMGMPNPALWGVMAACLNFVPFAGLALGTIIVTFVAFLTFDSVLYAMLAPLIYLTANGLEANIITPSILGKSLQLNTIAIFISIVIAQWMWGIGGALIAVPILAVIKIACDHFESMAPLGHLLQE